MNKCIQIKTTTKVNFHRNSQYDIWSEVTDIEGNVFIMKTGLCFDGLLLSTVLRKNGLLRIKSICNFGNYLVDENGNFNFETDMFTIYSKHLIAINKLLEMIFNNVV